MVLSHVSDSWTRAEDRAAWPFRTVEFIGGLGAPLFLFIAGVSLALAASSKGRRGTMVEAARQVRRRGWQIFGLAFLFRLQALILGLGDPITLLTVDILNVMGLSMVAGGWLWQTARSWTGRVAVLAGATIAVAVFTPAVWTTAWLSWMPDPLRWYLQPTPGHTNFTLLPSAGFLFAGVPAGLLIDRARGRGDDARLYGGLAATGVLVFGAGWLASFGPPVFEGASFWGSSPAFFAVRLGILILLIPAGWGHFRMWHGPGDSGCGADGSEGGWSWKGLAVRAWHPFDHVVETLGRSSLFVYWIHVEMVYGVIATPIKQRLPLPASLAAVAALCLLLYALVRLKNRWRQAPFEEDP